jgi:hypothetical protein
MSKICVSIKEISNEETFKALKKLHDIKSIIMYSFSQFTQNS